MTDFSKITALYHINRPCGFTLEELEPVRSIFGAIPQALVDYYTELGKYDFNQNQDSLSIPKDYQSGRRNTDEYLIIYAENQWSCVWGIHKDDVRDPDPPVYFSNDETTWVRECDTTTEFLHAMAYLQAIFYLDYHPDTFFELEEDGVEFIKKHYRDKGVSLRNWTTGIAFFGNNDDQNIILMGGEEQCAYSSMDEAEFRTMDDVLSKLGSPM